MDHSPVSVLIVDDQAQFRRAAAAVVSLTPGFAVVAEAESGEEGVETAAAISPDLVLMDINLPGINGLESTRRIVAANPAVTVVLFSTYLLDDLPADARVSGAAGYINKEELDPTTLEAVWQNRANGSWAA